MLSKSELTGGIAKQQKEDEEAVNYVIHKTYIIITIIIQRKAVVQ